MNEPAKLPKELRDWNLRLLPLMSRMLIGLTLFFFLTTAFQLVYLHLEIGKSPKGDFESATKMLEEARRANEFALPTAAIAVQVALERNALERRYHQANVSLMSRVWTRYLGFVTGMILAMVGAVFILGRLQAHTSEVAAKAGGAGFDFKTDSPGLIIAGLGVLLMVITIVTHHEIRVDDRAIYAAGWSLQGSGGPSAESEKPQGFPVGEPNENPADEGVPVSEHLQTLRKEMADDKVR